MSRTPWTEERLREFYEAKYREKQEREFLGQKEVPAKFNFWILVWIVTGVVIWGLAVAEVVHH